MLRLTLILLLAAASPVLAQTASGLVIRGIVQNASGAVTVIADRMSKLDMRVASKSRDFQ